MSLLRSIPRDSVRARAGGAPDRAAILSVLALPCLFVCAAAWLGARITAGIVPSRDRWRPRVAFAERAAVPSLSSSTPRAPEAASGPADDPRVVAVDESPPAAQPAPTRTVENVESVMDVGSSGSWESEGWSSEPVDWEGFWERIYTARAARRARWLSEVRARWALRTSIEASLLGATVFDAPSACGPFACGQGSPEPPIVSGGVRPTTVRAAGSRWTLANAFTTVTIDRSAACRIETLRVGALEPVLFDPTDGASTDECSVHEQPYTRGVALEIRWNGPTWTRRMVVSLDDAARDPEATVARFERSEHGDALTEVINLGRAPRPWNVAGRSLTVDPGHAAHVLESSRAE
jgi:hypothetical protein